MERITSRTNPVVKEFRGAAARSGTLLLLDGAHLLDEALACGVRVEVVALEERFADGAPGSLARRAAAAGARVLLVSAAVLDAMSPVRTPSGVVALARRPDVTLNDALETVPQLLLVLAGVQDPGNVGAIVRAGDACGATGIVAGEGSADPFGWKALRGSMGSVFHLPVVTAPLGEIAGASRQRRVRLVATVPRGGTPLPECDLRGPVAVLLGGEGGGIPDAILSLADAHVTIPMVRPVESLNVATAAAILTYEAMRQRQETTA